ncbi:MAG: ABC transporter permease [Balneolales bacterium]
MKAFLGFIVKEFYHIFRDRRTLLILFGMPLVQLLLFGYAIRNELNKVDIAVLDQARDEVTREVIDKLLASGHFQLSAYPDSEEEIGEIFQKGIARGVVIFEPGFGRKFVHDGRAGVHIITDASDPNMAQMLDVYMSNVIHEYQREQAEQNRGDVNITATGVVPQIRMLFNPDLRSANLFVPGLIAFILMLVSAFLTSITIAREKEQGTMEILLVSPLNPLQIIIGKVLPYLLLSVINVFMVLVVALMIFQVPFRGSLVLFTLLCILFIMTALALGVRISSIVRDQQTAMMMSLAGLLLPTILLSGFIFPIANMPAVLQWISHIVPAKWFLIIIRGIMLKGSGMEHLWKEALILFGMMLILLVSSIRSFKIRLE